MDPKHHSPQRETMISSPHCAWGTQAAQLINYQNGIRVAQSTDYKWDAKYSERQSELRLFVSRSSVKPLDIGLLRPAWVQLKRLRTYVERFQSFMHQWVLASMSICECGALDQTVAHVIMECPSHLSLRGCHGLLIVDNDALRWLISNIVSNIWGGPFIRRRELEHELQRCVSPYAHYLHTKWLQLLV